MRDYRMFAKVLRSRWQHDRKRPASMTINRREFLKVSALAGAAGCVLLPGVAKPATRSLVLPQSVKPLRLLILGGTGFTGPFQVKYALNRGHHVTVFNRGLTHPGESPREVEQLVGDRNGQL